MSKIADHLGIHQQALNLRAQRNEVLASNIANASTPNFKAESKFRARIATPDTNWGDGSF